MDLAWLIKSNFRRDIGAVNAVPRRKVAMRGSSSPFVPPHLAGAKGNTEGGPTAKSPFRRKGFGKGKQSMVGPRQRRDERRQFEGLVEVPMAAVIHSTPLATFLMAIPIVEGDQRCGRILQTVLKLCSLGLIRMEPPAPCGGLGGRATVLGTALTPLRSRSGGHDISKFVPWLFQGVSCVHLELLSIWRDHRSRILGRNRNLQRLYFAGHPLMHVAQDVDCWSFVTTVCNHSR